MTSYIYLALAIIAEVIATNSLKASDGFTKLMPTGIVIIGYAIAFWLLSLVLRTVPIGIAYATWAGLGIVLVTIVAIFVHNQKPDLPAILGIGLIVSGVVVTQLFSKMSVH